MDAILQSGLWYRIGISLAITLSMIAWEYKTPLRERVFPRIKRWPVNFLFLIVNGIGGKLLAFVSPMVVAIYCEQNGYGLLHLIGTAPWLNIVLSVVFLDFCIYFQHLVFHRYEIFWRFHGMHHSDLDLDVSSGGRFHPVEIILSLIIKSVLVFLIGVSPLAILVFEVILNGTATFNHSNIKLSTRTEQFLTKFLVTPKFHLSHHSERSQHCNRNFGFNFPWWDRMFGTFEELEPQKFDALVLGNTSYKKEETVSLASLLKVPFKNQKPDS